MNMNNIISPEDLQKLSDVVGSAVTVIDTKGPYTGIEDLPLWYRPFMTPKMYPAIDCQRTGTGICDHETDSVDHRDSVSSYSKGEITDAFTVGFIPAKRQYVRIYARPGTDYYTTLGEISKQRMMDRHSLISRRDFVPNHPKPGYDIKEENLGAMIKRKEDLFKMMLENQSVVNDFIENKRGDYSCFSKILYKTDTHFCFELDEGFVPMRLDDFIDYSPLKRQFNIKEPLKITDTFIDIIKTLKRVFDDTKTTLNKFDTDLYYLICDYKNVRNGQSNIRRRMFEAHGIGISVNNLIPENFMKKVDSSGKIIDWQWCNEFEIRRRPPSIFWEFTKGKEFNFSEVSKHIDNMSNEDLRGVDCFIYDESDVTYQLKNSVVQPI